MNSKEVKTKIDGLQQELDTDYEKVERAAEKCNDLIRKKFWDHFKSQSAVEIKNTGGHAHFFFRADGSDDCSDFLRKSAKCVYNGDGRCERSSILQRRLLNGEIKTIDGKTIANVLFENMGSFSISEMQIRTEIVKPFLPGKN